MRPVLKKKNVLLLKKNAPPPFRNANTFVFSVRGCVLRGRVRACVCVFILLGPLDYYNIVCLVSDGQVLPAERLRL